MTQDVGSLHGNSQRTIIFRIYAYRVGNPSLGVINKRLSRLFWLMSGQERG
jgi:hypothetical protein